MKRRSFIRNISSLGLASVAVGTSFAAETPQSNSLPGKSKIPVYDGWDVIVVGGGPSGCAAATAAAREGAKTLLMEGTGALGGMGTSALLRMVRRLFIKELRNGFFPSQRKVFLIFIMIIGCL